MDITTGGPGTNVSNDGITDVAGPLQVVLDTARPAGVVRLNGGYYNISSGITIPAGVHLQGPAAIFLSHGPVAVTVLGDRGEHAFSVRRPAIDWFAGADVSSVGVRVLNGDYNRLRVRVEHFYTGVEVVGDGTGAVGNRFEMPFVRNCRTGFYVYGVGGGWANQGQIVGGMVRLDSAYAQADTTGVLLNRVSGWTLDGVNLEGAAIERAVVLDSCAFCEVRACRFEATKSGGLYLKGATCHANIIAGGYGLYKPLVMDEGKENVILSTRGFVSNHDAGTVYGFGAAYVGKALSGVGDKILSARNTAGQETAHLRSDGEWRARKYTVQP